MFCVGLTGSIGSGKTTVARFFAKLGVTIVDADIIAREITEPGAPGYTAVLAHFGKKILTQQHIDRKQLRQIIFKNPAEKKALEKILHPLILEAMRERIRHATSPYCIAVIPLLAEVFSQIDFVTRVCVVDAPEHLSKQWAAERDHTSLLDIEAIMAAQIAHEERLALADDVILNNQDLAGLERQVKILHRQYLQMAAS